MFQNEPSASCTSACDSMSGFQSSAPDVTRLHVCAPYLVSEDLVPPNSFPLNTSFSIIHWTRESFFASSRVTSLTHESNSFSPHPSGYATSRSKRRMVSSSVLARMTCDNHTGPVIAFAMHLLPKSIPRK